MRFAYVFFIMLVGTLSFFSKKGLAEQQILIWQLKAGNYNDDQNPVKTGQKTVNQSSLPHSVVKLQDFQYRKAETYRAIKLKDLINQGKPSASQDMAILVFKNNMRVPVYLSGFGSDMLDQLYLAEAICKKTPGKNKSKKNSELAQVHCESAFPEISKEDSYAIKADPRPIRFYGNKIVSLDGRHPDTADPASFSPWNHVDSLQEIILASGDAYWNQFNIGESEGFAVFKQRCQFCHSVNYVGSRFGWDFTRPMSLAEKRQPDQLMNHIKYPKALRTEKGLMMPTQKDISESEIKTLWKWMHLVSKKPLNPYRP